jgi:hypothetical protein
MAQVLLQLRQRRAGRPRREMTVLQTSDRVFISFQLMPWKKGGVRPSVTCGGRRL